MTARLLALGLDGVRLLALADAVPLQALLRRSGAYFRAADGRDPSAHAALERLAEAAGDENVKLWGGWQRGALVGLLEARLHEPAPGEVTVVLLLIDPAVRRRGLGREMVESLAATLPGSDWAALHLGVQDPQTGAHGFWRALGFTSEGGEDGVTRYVRPLP